ncbi:uncharacterized protein LOC134077283 [Sardina pilchardus]|uniref:uncharacterized protein LOC134077283 n=1 Tax=Sardina pilchardus TaxID=27697 RepID=UPI002E0DD91E
MAANKLGILYELESEQLKQFRTCLSEMKEEGFTPIPKEKLNDSDATDVVDKMREAYGEEDMKEITLLILRKMDLKIRPADELESNLPLSEMKEEEVEPIPKEQQKDTDGEEDNNLPLSEMKEEEVEPIPKEQQKDTDGEEDNNLPQSEMKEEEVEPIPKEQQKDTDGEEDNNLPQSEMKEEEVEPIPKEQQKDTDGEEDK